MAANSCGFVCLYQGVPGILKVLVSQEFPAWVRPLYVGVVGAAAACLALLVNKYISISVSLR